MGTGEPPRRRSDADRLSHNPSAIRQRLRRGGRYMTQDLEMYTEVMFGEEGYKPIEDWDFEELQHGKPRGAGGKFQGRKPKWIDPLLEQEIARRLRAGVHSKIAEQAGAAVKVLTDFLKNSDEPRLRFEAAKLILEYVAGKPQQHLAIDGNVTLQHMLAGALVLDDDTPAHPIIEGTFEEESDDDLPE